MGVIMRTSEKKRDFLKSLGFEQTYESEPKRSFGVLTNMEKWSLVNDIDVYHLYIHFEEHARCYCNLYYGTDDGNADEFSERNLISELKKRGFKEGKKDNEDF